MIAQSSTCSSMVAGCCVASWTSATGRRGFATHHAVLDMHGQPAIRVPMDLVEVHFAAAGKTVFVRPGTTLLAAAGLAGVDVTTGCTRGMCGTDAARIVTDPPDALFAAIDPERGTLARMGLAGGCRLLCSARVQRGRVEVRGDALVD
jgi:ferredoxin